MDAPAGTTTLSTWSRREVRAKQRAVTVTAGPAPHPDVRPRDLQWLSGTDLDGRCACGGSPGRLDEA